MKYIKMTIFESVVAFLLAFFTVFSPVIRTSADGAGEISGVMEDLQSAENFDAWDYPSIADDYSLQVIQIAESAQGRLFVYVYQPSHWTKDLQATTLRVGLPQVGVETTYKDYTLKLTSTAGVFDKYEVTGLELPTGAARYYELVAIHRAFDGSIDDEPETETEQETQEVVYEVAQTWRAETTESGVKYAVSVLDVIEVTAKVVGYIRYDQPSIWFDKSCDSHFVAFSIDRKIDNLTSASVDYTATATKEEYSAAGFGAVDMGDGTTLIKNYRYTYGEPQKKRAELSADKKLTFDGSGFLVSKNYEWKEISTTDEFIKSDETVKFTTGAAADLSNTDYVLRFHASEYDIYGVNGATWTKEYEKVENVTILRLGFDVDGVAYNLGVVDNKQSGGQLGEDKENMAWWVYVLICAAIVFAFFFIVLPLLKVLFKILFVPADIVDFFAGFGGRRK